MTLAAFRLKGKSPQNCWDERERPCSLARARSRLQLAGLMRHHRRAICAGRESAGLTASGNRNERPKTSTRLSWREVYMVVLKKPTNGARRIVRCSAEERTASDRIAPRYPFPTPQAGAGGIGVRRLRHSRHHKRRRWWVFVVPYEIFRLDMDARLSFDAIVASAASDYFAPGDTNVGFGLTCLNWIHLDSNNSSGLIKIPNEHKGGCEKGGPMVIVFKCICGKPFRVQADRAGKRGWCPSCDRDLVVPERRARKKTGAPRNTESGTKSLSSER